MNGTGKAALLVVAFTFAVIPLLSQTTSQTTSSKPSFEVVSIKPSAPNLGLRGGGPCGDRLMLVGMSLKMLLQLAYSRPNTSGQPTNPNQLQVIGGPNWIDSDRYDIEAKADCRGGILPREQMQLMVQSMLEDRFQLKARMETRERPIYNLVVGKDGHKINVSADQTPATPFGGRGGPPQPCDPATAGPLPVPPPPPPPPGQRGVAPSEIPNMPRGAMVIGVSPNGISMQATAVPITNLVNVLRELFKTTVPGVRWIQEVNFCWSGLNLGTASIENAVPLTPSERLL
jgi:uncharacterized protein (TIGR03435 family)